ncbi:unnamed protein product, partial [Chrysoparadoxa australica]
AKGRRGSRGRDSLRINMAPKVQDTSATRVRKQRKAIETLRHNNELGKTELARESRESRYVTNPLAVKDITRLQEQADLYAKKIEQERQKIKSLDEKVLATQAKVLEQRQKMGGLTASQENNEMIAKQIRMLENRLDKSLVKFNESLAYNRNLREKLDAMRRERVVFDGIYKKLERELHEKKKEMAAIIEDSNNACKARDKTQGEMAALRQQAEKDRMEFEAEWKELKKLIEQDRKLRESMRQRKLQKTLEARQAGAMQAAGDVHDAPGGGDGSWHDSKEEDREGEEKAQSYEAAFQKIKEATGLEDVNDIVNNFLEAEEKNFSLFNFVNDLNSEIERLELVIAETKNEIEKYKGQGVSTDTQRKKALRSLEVRLNATEKKAEEYEARHQESMKVVNQLKSGIHSIFSRVGAGSNNTSMEELLGNQGVTESNMMQYVALVEQRASEILQVYAQTQNLTAQPLGEITGNKLNSTTELLLNLPGVDDINSWGESDEEEDDRPLTRVELRKATHKMAAEN